MNELEFLRSQLRLEQTRLQASGELLQRAMRRAGAGSPAAPVAGALRATLAHLAFALPRALERGRLHAQLVSERIARAGGGASEQRAAHDALAALQAALASTEEAVVALAGHDANTSSAAVLIEVTARVQRAVERITATSTALEPWFARLYDLSDWRQAARIDAESVFEERRLHDAAVDAARAGSLLD